MKHKPEFITRHMDLIQPAAYQKRIVVVGAGAIGSFTVLALAKMGYCNIHVYDYDTVENENISAQFFNTASIGKKKVDALREMVWNFTGIEISIYDHKVEPTERLQGDIVIAAVDSMAVRKMLYEISDCHWLIDPRMGAEYATLEVLSMSSGTKSNHEAYRKTLFDDKDAVQERCTAKTTIYTVLLIAGQVVKAVKDITTTDQAGITSLDWNIKLNAMLAFSDGRIL